MDAQQPVVNEEQPVVNEEQPAVNEQQPTAEVQPKRSVRGRLGWAAAIIAAFFFAADLFEGLANLVAIGGSPVATILPPLAWLVLVLLVLAPLLIYGAVLWFTRLMRAGSSALIFCVALAFSATVALSLQSLFRVVFPGF